MRKPRLVVIGSSNTDLVVRVDRLPSPGETVVGGDLSVVQGGKGANQAVAAVRLGADVHFVARVGDDASGNAARSAYRAEGIGVDHVLLTRGVPTGTALIPVESGSGRNAIVVSPGANSRLSPTDIESAASMIQSADLVVISFEIPLPSIEAAVRIANRHGVPLMCNPAPARPLSDDILRAIRWMTPNEEECEQYGGAGTLVGHGIEVIATHGDRGAFYHFGSEISHYPAPNVTPVDTVAAGDCFTAALAVAIASRQSMAAAIPFAVAAASLKVTRYGAQPGLPYRADVEQFMKSFTH